VKTNIISPRHLCACCETNRTTFNTRRDPRFRARADHDLCSRCFRSYRAAFRRWSEANTLNGWLL
jgi:hypothetical protein